MNRKSGRTLSAAGQKEARAPIDQTEPFQHSAGNIDALGDSEALFRAIFENAAVGIARVGLDGRWLEVNQRLCDIMGYSREELMTKTFVDITHPDDLDQDVEAARGMLAGKIDIYSIEKRYFRKDGSVVWGNLTVSMTRKADGSPDYFISIIEDITESKLAEEAKLKRVALFADVSAALAEHGRPLQSMMQKSAEAMVRRLDAAFARIWTLNPEESLLELQASAGLYTHLNGKHSRIRVGEFKIGLIAKERKPHLTNDMLNDPHISDQEWARENGIEAFAGYPLLVEDRVVGVMAMFADHPLTEATIDAIATIAAPIAQGIERKRAEEALRASEEQFRILADTAPVMIWCADTNKLCTFFNQPWLDFTGRAMEEELGDGWTEGVHSEDYERCLKVYVTSFEAREPFEMEYRLRRHDGEYRWILDHGVPRFSPSGDFLGYIGSCIDITERREVEEELRESKDRLAGIVRSAMDAIITVDEDQRIVLFNEAAERMFGCPASKALGQRIARFIPARFRCAHAEYVRRFGETGGANRARGRPSALVALRADGSEFPIEASISAIEVGGRKLYTVIYRDITERKQAEAEREQLEQEQVARATAEAANRSKDEFLALVSHELRSPLNAILGYTRMLRAYSLDKDAADNATAAVERSAKAQLQIIEDLLDSARIVTGKLQIEPGPVDLASALEAALDTVRPAAEAKGVTLVADFGQAPAEALGDSVRLQQVVWNLLSNAVKFTPEGGRVELRMEGDDDNVHITVSDTGKGIKPEFLPFVFDRFRQADTSGARRYGGLGLGLSIAKHLVELHGGTIAAASEGPGRGATFTVTLPRRHTAFAAPPREARAEATVTPGADLSLEGVRVLAVDDQEEARVILTQTLIEYGAQVTAVSSGAEALALLSDPSSGGRPDALILDIAMPEEDGYTVLKKVRELEAGQGARTRIPAVALTACGRSEDRLRALQAGFQTHVVKPADPAELALVIASMTGRNVWSLGRKE